MHHPQGRRLTLAERIGHNMVGPGLTRPAGCELARQSPSQSVSAGPIDVPLANVPATEADLVRVNRFAMLRMASVDEIARNVLFVAFDDASSLASMR